MAANTTSTLSNQYQKYFSKELLKYAVQALVLAQFGQKTPLPKKTGAKSVRWFRWNAPQSGYAADGTTVIGDSGGTGITTLTEGTPLAAARYRTLTQSIVDANLVQYGQVVQNTDILTSTEFFSSMEQSTKINGEDAAFFCDTNIRNLLVSSGTTKRYSGGAANFTALSGLTKANGKFAAVDALDAVTQLRINRAPMINGAYVGVVCPQVARDMQNDADWKAAKQYSDVTDLYKGEIGMFHGARFILSTNPWIEDEAEGTYDTVDDDADGLIYSSFFLGEQAFGITDLESQSPMSPQVIITDKADKSDPLNQTINVGFKTFWASKELNTAYFVVHRSKSLFA